MEQEDKPKFFVPQPTEIKNPKGVNKFLFDESHHKRFSINRFSEIHADSNNLHILLEHLYACHKYIHTILNLIVSSQMTYEKLYMRRSQKCTFFELTAVEDILRIEIWQLLFRIDKDLDFIKKHTEFEKLYCARTATYNIETVKNLEDKLFLASSYLQDALAVRKGGPHFWAPIDSLEKMTQQIVLQAMYIEQYGTDNIREEIKYTMDEFAFHLDHHFKEYLKFKNVEMINRCMQIYSNIGMQKTAEKIISEHIKWSLKEHFEVCFFKPKKDQVSLLPIYDHLERFVSEVLSIVLEATVSKVYHIKGFNLLANCFWPSLEDLWEQLPDIAWYPMQPMRFRLCYITEYEFRTNLNDKYMTTIQTREWKHSTEYKRFVHRWNNGVTAYIQIISSRLSNELARLLSRNINFYDNEFLVRSQSWVTEYEEEEMDIAIEIDEAVQTDQEDEENAEEEDEQFCLVISEKILNIIIRSMDESNILPLHTGKFWAILINLLSDYISWVTDLADEPTEKEDPILKLLLLRAAHHDAFLIVSRLRHDVDELYARIPDRYTKSLCEFTFEAALRGFTIFLEAYRDSSVMTVP